MVQEIFPPKLDKAVVNYMLLQYRFSKFCIHTSYIGHIFNPLFYFLFPNSRHMYWNRFHQQTINAGHQKHPGIVHVTSIFVGFYS